MREKLVYLGWQGRRNFGDDMMWEAWRRRLRKASFIQAPLYREDWARLIQSGLPAIMRRGKMRVLIGGGTVLGYANWARHVERTQRIFGSSELTAIGIGAPDINVNVDTKNQPIDLEAWRRIEGLSVFGVRGPRSLATAEECGFRTQIVGDPGLMYGDGPITRKRHEVKVGICLGHSPRHRPVETFGIDSIVSGLKEVFPRSQTVVLQLADEDRASADLLHSALRRAGWETAYASGGVQDLMNTVAECDVVVSQRLHGLVAAASVGAVPVGLPYEAKTYDFMESIDSRALVPTGPTAEELSQAFEVARAVESRHKVCDAVVDLRNAFRAAVKDSGLDP